MYRAEIIANQSVEENVIELLEERIPDIQYTIFPEIHGSGARTKKLGDTVWPEMNFDFFTYIDLDGAKKIKETIEELKEKFPNEGISLFFTQTVEL